MKNLSYRKGERAFFFFFLVLSSTPFASPVIWLILISLPLWVLLSHLLFSLFSTSLSSLTSKSPTLSQQRASTYAHTLKACCLATEGWDRCRPIREASQRAMKRGGLLIEECFGISMSSDKVPISFWPLDHHLE